MDIDDIERHKYNFRLFCKFIKQKGVYQALKKLIFINNNITPHDLFLTMDTADIRNIICNIDRHYCEIDRKWSAIFNYVPFCRFYWTSKKGEVNNRNNMLLLTMEWSDFLKENNYDKQ